MADTTITGLPTANTIDATQDWLPIDTTSLNTTQKINRNTLLGITGAPLGTTDSQSVSNKTLGNTNTVTLKDTLFTLQDDGDITKQAKFQLSGITTATTRTYTLPNASGTIADIASAQTFTNKTLTSPTITGGSISNATISVDSIAEFTAANGVTVDGMNIKDGKLNTNNSVVTSNITDTAITPAKLQSGTGSSWSWQAWTPTWTGITIGNATVDAKYIQTGKTVTCTLSVVFGSSTTVTGQFVFSLPVTAAGRYNGSAGGQFMLGNAYIEDAGVSSFVGFILVRSTTTAALGISNTTGTYAGYNNPSSGAPLTWATGDLFAATFIYEAP